MSDAQGGINFTMFLTLFGERLQGTDPEDVIKNAFGCFDEENLVSWLFCTRRLEILTYFEVTKPLAGLVFFQMQHIVTDSNLFILDVSLPT